MNTDDKRLAQLKKRADEMKIERRIIEALEDKPLCNEDLHTACGFGLGGGELSRPLRLLMERGTITRIPTYRYELSGSWK